MSRLTGSGIPNSAALVDHEWRRSWKVRSSIPAALTAPVNPVLMSEMALPSTGLSKMKRPRVVSLQRDCRRSLTLRHIGTDRGRPFLLFLMKSQPGGTS